MSARRGESSTGPPPFNPLSLTFDANPHTPVYETVQKALGNGKTALGRACEICSQIIAIGSKGSLHAFNTHKLACERKNGSSTVPRPTTMDRLPTLDLPLKSSTPILKLTGLKIQQTASIVLSRLFLIMGVVSQLPVKLWKGEVFAFKVDHEASDIPVSRMACHSSLSSTSPGNLDPRPPTPAVHMGLRRGHP